MAVTKFNPVQLHLLQLFSHNLGEADLNEVKTLLANYFLQKADEEMRHIQTQKDVTQADLNALLNAHLRTPYKA